MTRAETGQPAGAGRNLVNTHNNYRKCEENCEESNVSFRDKRILTVRLADSWFFKHNSNYNRVVSILVSLFLAVCFMISMCGVLFMFTSLFIGCKFDLINTFINECNLLTILLVFFLTGIHLITTGATGVLGLGRHHWLLFVHLLLGVGALCTLGTTYHFGPYYEPDIFEDVEMMMWCSLTHNRGNYSSEGWDYMQFNMECCGVNGYTDWCTYKNTEGGPKKNNNKSLRFRNVSNSDYIEDSTENDSVSTQEEFQPLKFNPNSPDNDNETTLEDVENNVIPNSQQWNILNEEYTLISCYVPATCCVKDIRQLFKLRTQEDKYCVKKNASSNFHNRGCYLPVMQLMRNFVDSFMKIIKCIISILVLDLSIAVFLIFFY